MLAESAVADARSLDTRRSVQLHSLGVRNFRNLARVELALPADGVAIIGDNGHGKTNLLEAIAYFAVLRSLRGVRDRDLVRFGEKAFSLTADAEGGAAAGGAPVHVTIGFETGTAARKHVTIDGVRVQRLSDAFGAIPSVTIAPSDVALVAGAPGERRRYLDVLLAMTDRRYLSALQHYRAALVRRNATLRRSAARGDARSDSEISVWDNALAEAGAVIRAARSQWLGRYAADVAASCAAMGERERVALRYAAKPEFESGTHSEDSIRDQLQRAFEHDRTRDIRRQLTHAGPHRDDIAISLGGHALRTVGSAGQQRTIAIALRLVARAALTDATGRMPLMLLDDPFAELDAGRTARILQLLHDPGWHGMGQFIIAIPKAAELPGALSALQRLTIQNGVLAR